MNITTKEQYKRFLTEKLGTLRGRHLRVHTTTSLYPSGEFPSYFYGRLVEVIDEYFRFKRDNDGQIVTMTIEEISDIEED